MERLLDGLGMTYTLETAAVGPNYLSSFRTQKTNVQITMYRTSSTTHKGLTATEAASFLSLFDRYLESDRPDVILTFAVGQVGQCMIDLAKRRDIVTVAAIHNFAYTDPCILRNVDYCYTPSEFARRYYWDNHSISCHMLPNPIDWKRVQAGVRKPRFLTLVNPSPVKGVFAFARIASEIAHRHPGIPILVVEGRGRGPGSRHVAPSLTSVTI